MRINKRFYIFLTTAIFLFVMWLVFSDDLLLSLWMGMIAVIIFSWLISRNSVINVDLVRFSKKKNLEIGSIFEERLEIKNNSKSLKYWIEILDRSELLEKVNSRVITGLGSKKVAIFQSTVVLNKRGFFPLGPTELISGDPFGLFNISRTIHSKNHLLVYPRISELNRFPLLPADIAGSTSLMQHTTHPTPQAAGVREYTPGDPLSRVHWPTTVRRNKLMVKEFDEDSQSSVWLILDAQKGKYYREKQDIEPVSDRNYISMIRAKKYRLPQDSFEYAVSITASLANYSIKKNFPVGFACVGDKASVLTPDKGHRQLNKILETLATVLDKGTIPLEQLIEKQAKNISSGSALILITPTSEQSQDIYIEILRRKGFHVMKILLDNISFSQTNEEPVESKINPTGSVITVRFGDDIGKVLSIS